MGCNQSHDASTPAAHNETHGALTETSAPHGQSREGRKRSASHSRRSPTSSSSRGTSTVSTNSSGLLLDLGANPLRPHVDSDGVIHHSLATHEWVPVCYFGNSEDAKRRAVVKQVLEAYQ